MLQENTKRNFSKYLNIEILSRMESLNAESEKTHNTGSQVETNQFSLKLKKLKFDSPSDLNKKG